MARDLHQTDAARDHDDDAPEPAQIRRFRRLVSLLMVVMMVGILAIAGALVWKLTQPAGGPIPLPLAADIAVPKEMTVLSVSRAGPVLYLLIEETDTGERSIEERRASDRALLARYRLVPEQAE